MSTDSVLDASQDLTEEELDYHISPKDILKISVYPDEDLSRELTVTPVGTINFPLLGEIQVSGLTPSDMERKMTILLETDYLVNPQVYVKVIKFRDVMVSILGEVNRPGPYNLRSEEGETTLLESIAQAGGFSNIANIKKIKIIRTADGERKVYRVNGEAIIKGEKRDVALKPDDVVIIEESWF